MNFIESFRSLDRRVARTGKERYRRVALWMLPAKSVENTDRWEQRELTVYNDEKTTVSAQKFNEFLIWIMTIFKIFTGIGSLGSYLSVLQSSKSLNKLAQSKLDLMQEVKYFQ